MSGELIFGFVMTCLALMAAAAGQYFQWRFDTARKDAMAWEAVADRLAFDRDTLASLVDSGDFDGARELAGEILGRGKG